jgi:enoyl-CoA hydratase/carnithine racemase
VATQIAANAPLTILAAKQAMLSIANGRDNDSTRIDQLVDACFKSNDYAEGRLAFAQKRAPQFTGN